MHGEGTKLIKDCPRSGRETADCLICWESKLFSVLVVELAFHGDTLTGPT